MGLVINNNMMAANTARILSNTYDRLSTSVQRLSSGLRINGAADDAAGLAIRELMRADIATMQQGIRNAADGISLLQTAEGGMAVIDEKLVRMKELAEQAATGTYTTVQREIINSEYQAMAKEIDRIATATNFNGVKLLDGSISSIHHGMGLKLHFGTGNNPAEDYYFVQMGDVRATSKTGLRVGGDAKNDIWGTVATHGGPNTTGCCGGGIPTLNEPVPSWHSGEVFSFGYNWDWREDDDTALKKGRYIAGAWQVDATPTLQELLDMVNLGSQARVRIDFEYSPAKFTWSSAGYPPIDFTAYSAALDTTCGIDKNYRVTGNIPVIMANSATPPVVCFATASGTVYWPPATDFVYSATGSAWVLKDDLSKKVRFSGFSTADLTSGRTPSYHIISADGTSSHVYMSAKTDDTPPGAGLYRSAAGEYWMDIMHGSARVDGATARDEVAPEFMLPDGQPVPGFLVTGNSLDNNFQIKLGTHIVKTQAGGVTLADLLGRTSAPSPTSVALCVQDNEGHYQYTLNAVGSASLGVLSATIYGGLKSGDSVTADFLSALINFNGPDNPLTIENLLIGNIVRNSAFSASNTLGQTDYNGKYIPIYDVVNSAGGAHRICLGDEIYYIGNSAMGKTSHDPAKVANAFSMIKDYYDSASLWNSKANPFYDGSSAGRNWETIWAISALAYAINNNPNSEFWARLEGVGLDDGGPHQYRSGYTSLYVFSKEGGPKTDLKACDEQMGDIRTCVRQYSKVAWYNDELEIGHSAGTYFNNGGKDWGTLRAVPTGYGTWGVQLHGKDVGKERDLWILNVGEASNMDILTDPKKAFTGIGFGADANGKAINNLLGLDRQSFVEIQNAADGAWAGAHVRTQSDAQEALDAIQEAIERKDKVRATLGAYINRLENTITNLEIQAENLQASESRISDVDLATEMTTFVKNQVLTQAAVSMLSQANSLPQMALSLLNG